MTTLKKSKIFKILLFAILLILFANFVYASYELTSSVTVEIEKISKRASILHMIRISLIVFAILFILLIIANIDQFHRTVNLKFFLLSAILGLSASIFMGSFYFSEKTVENVFSEFSPSDFCYLYNGELLAFRFEENDENVILVCEKNRLENHRITKSIQSILSVVLKEDYNLDESLYNTLINSTATSEYITFEKNPSKTSFEQKFLDDSYEFIRITFNDDKLNEMSYSTDNIDTE